MRSKIRTQLLFALGAGLLALPVLFQGRLATPPSPPAPPARGALSTHSGDTDAASERRIQLALLLDTSGSMDGLLEQAKSQLWKVVNELSATTRDGQATNLEIALFEYGKSTLDARSGYVRRILPFTSDLDAVSEALFALTTNGGEEYCGHAIKTAAETLAWSADARDLKLLFIAGNEAFTQGEVPYTDAVAAAKARGISVSTIFCGPRSEGLTSGWASGAELAGGRFLAIDQDVQVAHIPSPMDEEIARLGAAMSSTYVPYGEVGIQQATRQIAQDSNARAYAGSLVGRSVAKASKAYKNAGWDLVDAVEEGKVAVESVDPALLPEPMKAMSPEARRAHVKARAEERAALKQRIQALSAERERFLAQERTARPEQATLDAAVLAAVRDQAQKAGFQTQARP